MHRKYLKEKRKAKENRTSDTFSFHFTFRSCSFCFNHQWKRLVFLKVSPLTLLQHSSSCPYTLYTLCKGSFCMHLRRCATAAVPWWGTAQSSQAYIPSEEIFLNQLRCKMISLPVGHEISYAGSEGEKKEFASNVYYFQWVNVSVKGNSTKNANVSTSASP